MKYESKQHSARVPASMMYQALSDFNNFTPMIQDKVEEWSVDGDFCTIKAQGMALTLVMDREAMAEQSRPADGVYTIKIFSADSPMPFGMWVQLKEVAPYDTRFRIVADVQLNAVTKMMIGKKLQKAIDSFAEQIAIGFGGK